MHLLHLLDDFTPAINNWIMYRRPKFLEVLLEIRQEMAREADYDVDLFAEIARSGVKKSSRHSLVKQLSYSDVDQNRDKNEHDEQS